MRNLHIAAIAIAGLALAAPAHALRAQRLPLPRTLRVEAARLSVAALTNGGYVVAATSYRQTEPEAVAQAFSPRGRAAGDELRCSGGPNPVRTFRSSVVRAADGFVFACESYHPHSDVVFTVQFRRYDARGNAVAPSVLLDSKTFTQLLGITGLDDGSVLLRLSECDESDCSENRGLVFGPSDDVRSLYQGPDFLTGAATALPDGFLVTGRARFDSRVFAQKVRLNGTPLQRKVRLGRTSGTYPEVVRGPGGRLAVTWRSSSLESGHEFAHVRFFDSAGTPDGDPLRVTLARSANPGVEIANVTALPLESGFALLWTTSAPALRAYAQRYTSAGRPTGQPIEIGASTLDLTRVVLEDDERSYLVSGTEPVDQSDDPWRHSLWRLDFGPAWGVSRE